jgi:hypothetical protein
MQADRLRQAYEVAEQALNGTAQARAVRHDKDNKSKREREFHNGDCVWLFSRVNKKGLACKLTLPEGTLPRHQGHRHGLCRQPN